MTESKLHEQKKVKNYLVGGILLLIVIFVFALAMVKIGVPEGAAPSDKTSATNAK